MSAASFGPGCSSCSKGSGASAGPGKTTPGMKIDIPRARAAYVTNNASDSISVIDLDGDRVVEVPLDLEPDAHEAPHHLAIDAATSSVFVALAFPPETKKTKDPHGGHGNAADVGRLARLDLATLAVKETRDVDENPGDVVLTHDRKRVLVTHFDMKRAMDVAAKGGASPSTMFAQLVIFDAKDMKRLGARPVCVAPHGVVTTKDDRVAYVACYGSDELVVVDLASDGFPTSRIPLGAMQGVPGVPRFGPYSATLSPDEKIVVVANLEGQDVRVLDRATKRFLPDKTVPLSAKAFMPAFLDDRTLLVPLQSPDGLARVDLENAKIEARASFPRDQCILPHVVRVANDGRVYLVCEGDHRAPGSVLEIDRASLAPKKRWAVGAYPDGMAFGTE
ncbi:MAG: YncE family protein [Labilithrix sp.]|nr:YncE family protein [Labilithrix sp.]